jgi:hypothetical protein
VSGNAFGMRLAELKCLIFVLKSGLDRSTRALRRFSRAGQDRQKTEVGLVS